MKYSILYILILIVLVETKAKAQSTKFDIATIDFYKYPNLKLNECTFFGVSFGMKIKEVEAAIKSYKKVPLTLVQDKFNAYRMYIAESIYKDSITLPLIYCIWDGANEGLKEIVIQDEFCQCHPNGAELQPLFSCAFKDSTTKYYQNYLQNATSVKVDESLKSINMITTEYYYPQCGLIIGEYQQKKSTYYQLIIRKSYN
jgi:hypothetical protein